MFKSGYRYVICRKDFDGSIHVIEYYNQYKDVLEWQNNMPSPDEMYNNGIHAYYCGFEMSNWKTQGNFGKWEIL